MVQTLIPMLENKIEQIHKVSSNHAQMLRGDGVTCMAAYLVFELVILKQEHSIAIAVFLEHIYKNGNATTLLCKKLALLETNSYIKASFPPYWSISSWLLFGPRV